MYILKGLKGYSLLRVITYKKEDRVGVGTADTERLFTPYICVLWIFILGMCHFCLKQLKKSNKGNQKAYEIFK